MMRRATRCLLWGAASIIGCLGGFYAGSNSTTSRAPQAQSRTTSAPDLKAADGSTSEISPITHLGTLSDKLLAVIDLDAVSRRINAIGDPIERQDAFTELLDQLVPIDFSAAIALIGKHPELEWALDGICVRAPFRFRPHQVFKNILTLPPSSNRDAILEVLLVTPAAIDAGFAREISLAIEDPDVRARAERGLVDALVWVHPDTALEMGRAFDLENYAESRIDAYQLRERFEAKINDDAAEALSDIARLPTETLERESLLSWAISRIPADSFSRLERLPGTGVPAVVDRLLEADSVAAGDSALVSEFLRKWINVEGIPALESVLSDSRLEPSHDSAWKTAAVKQPLEVIQYALEKDGDRSLELAVSSGIQTLTRDDPFAARAVIDALLEDPTRRGVVGEFVLGKVGNALAGKMPVDQLWEWANSMPEPLIAHAARVSLSSAANTDLDGVENLLRSLPPGSSKEMHLHAIAEIVRKADPARAFEMLIELPESERRENGLLKVLDDWRTIDAASAETAAARLSGH